MKTHQVSMARLKRPDSRRGHGLIVASAIIAATMGCASMEPVIAEPGVEFSLPVGKTAAINGDGTKITFRQVREDSRCPTDVTCVWEGDARIEVTIHRANTPDETAFLSLRSPNSEIRSGSLLIRLVGLAPVPRQADGNTPRPYVARLIVNRT